MKITTSNNKRDAGMGRQGDPATVILMLAVSLTLFGFMACRGGEKPTVNTAAPAATPEKKVDDFQDNLNSVQRAGFKFIYAFRRADGGIFNGEDKKYLKDNSPPETNQWRLTEDEKAVIAGSNYKFFPNNLEALRKRFAVEDYSKPELVEENVNTNLAGENATANSNGVK